MTDLNDYEPPSFEEVVSQKVWVDDIVKEYKSIMKKNV